MKTTKQKAPTSKKRLKKKTAVLYTRKASCELGKPNKHLMNQEKKLREYCKKKNIKVVKVIYDFGSGLDFNRPEFESFLKELKDGMVKADYFLFTSIDRFCRRLDLLHKMHYQLIRMGIKPKAIESVNLVYFAAFEVKTKK